MISLTLDNRLASIVKEINCNSLADIGCDHGKVAIAALLENRARHVIASDISINSLNKVKELSLKYGISDHIDFICGNGLVALPILPDCAVIAGLGAHTIINILTTPRLPMNLILSPNSCAKALREFLNKSKWHIKKDYIVESHRRFYTIILVDTTLSGIPYSHEELIWGKNDPSSNEFVLYLEHELMKIEKFSKKTTSALERASTAKKLLKKYKC
ncbi:MAG: class I SAM-dependent methyltransferase [Christensenellaceae bacterium]|jgi:tRNA (adenine22-N1)-methyltransferase|nr:class I SAM-dependent methyltransferase [Christensenellaceae bacterium]